MENEISITETCSYIKPNGQRCQAQKLRGSDFCYFHSPQLVVQRAEARRRGGLHRYGDKNETGSYVIKSPQDVLTILEDAINDAVALPNTQGRAKAIANLCVVILRGFEVTSLDDRLKALEDRIFRGK
jgi:hypothetical protein